MNDTLKQLTNKLRQDIDTMPPSLQAAAKYILDFPGDFGLDPIRVTAANIGVSSNALVRLALRMGFDGFNFEPGGCNPIGSNPTGQNGQPHHTPPKYMGW